MQIHWLGILLSVVAYMIIGMLWYSPSLFGNQWIKLIGKTKKDLKQTKMTTLYATSLLSAVVMAFVLDQFLQYAIATTLEDAIMVATMAWAGFVLTSDVVHTLFQGKSWKLALINAGYYYASLILMAIIFMAFK